MFTAHDNRVTMGGQFFPNGQGVAVDGGYRLTGAWSFGSGTGHSAVHRRGFHADGRRRDALDQPRAFPTCGWRFLPRDEVTFTDGWHVQGLKGTGSYDYNVADVFVPEYRTFPLFTREPLRGSSPAGRMGLMPVTAAGHAAWALGVAKSMLDDVEETRGHQVRMSDMAITGQPADLPEGSGPSRRGVAGRPPAGARRLHHGRGRGRRG